MEDPSNISGQWLHTALTCHDPSKLFDLICDINRYERSPSQPHQHTSASTTSSTSSSFITSPSSIASTKNLARIIALGKLAVRQNKREQAIRTASAGLSFYNETVQNMNVNTSGSTESSLPTPLSLCVATPLQWNIQGALLNEIMASWSNEDIVFYQRAIQLLQVRIGMNSS